MKNYLYPIIMLFACSLFSCESQEPGDNGNGDEKEPVKYLIESSSVCTYAEDPTASYLNIPIKQIYTRKQGDSKFLLGVEQYSSDVLTFRTVVTNEGNKEIHTVECFMCNEEARFSTETYIWHDEQRTKYKEYSDQYGKQEVQYDDKNREIAAKNYQNDQLVVESKFEYVGLTQYAEHKQYNLLGELEFIKFDTVTYVDDAFTQPKLARYAQKSPTLDLRGTWYAEYEYGPYGILSKRTTDVVSEPGGAVSEYVTQITYTWINDLYVTYVEEASLNKKVYNISEGYIKYTY